MKILASDYDGTLNYYGVDDTKRAAIARWRKAGNRFGLVSGREIKDLVWIVENDGFECDFLIANNGAVLAAPDGTILKESRCAGEVAIPLLKLIFEWDCTWTGVYSESSYIVKATAEECFPGEYTLDTLPPIPYFNQVSVGAPSVEVVPEIVAAIHAQFGDQVTALQNHTCIDIVPVGVDKAQGLYKLIEHLGASYDDVITVGDNMNDAAMIGEFRSYGMENGVAAIKELATAVTPSVTALIERELAE